jgi:hypothetical protein
LRPNFSQDCNLAYTSDIYDQNPLRYVRVEPGDPA